MRNGEFKPLPEVLIDQARGQCQSIIERLGQMPEVVRFDDEKTGEHVVQALQGLGVIELRQGDGHQTLAVTVNAGSERNLLVAFSGDPVLNQVEYYHSLEDDGGAPMPDSAVGWLTYILQEF